MDRDKRINLMSILLAIAGVAMVIIGIIYTHPAPVVTGIGFFITVWGFQEIK